MKNDKKKGKYICDLNFEDIEQKIATPYQLGDILFIKGESINPRDIQKIEIRKTQESFRTINSRYQKKDKEWRDKAEPLVSLIMPYNSLELTFNSGEDVLDDFIKGPVGYQKEAEESMMKKTISNSEKIFIGHGRSPIWLELKIFLQEKLGLKCDEFNSVSSAGKPTQARLSEMLDNASFAFLVLTAEDEQLDGKLTARPNVIHEVGLFQGRLGFEKAIVLKEDECEEFSNIVGLGQIRFPQGNIKAKFEEIREVLAREGIIMP